MGWLGGECRIGNKYKAGIGSIDGHKAESTMSKWKLERLDKNQMSKQIVQVEPSRLIDKDDTRNDCQIQVARYHIRVQVARSNVQA